MGAAGALTPTQIRDAETQTYFIVLMYNVLFFFVNFNVKLLFCTQHSFSITVLEWFEQYRVETYDMVTKHNIILRFRLGHVIWSQSTIPYSSDVYYVQHTQYRSNKPRCQYTASDNLPVNRPAHWGWFTSTLRPVTDIQAEWPISCWGLDFCLVRCSISL